MSKKRVEARRRRWQRKRARRWYIEGRGWHGRWSREAYFKMTGYSDEECPF